MYEEEWVPSTGIRLLKEGTIFSEIGVADFRVEKLQLDKVFLHLQRFLSTLPLNEKMTVQNSWDRLRENIEKIPTRTDKLKKMKLMEIPTQAKDIPKSLPAHFSHLSQEEIIPDLEGEVFPESLDEADFEEDVKEGLDVLVYSKSKKGRPWCGRVVKIMQNHQFLIHWFARQKGNSNTFVATYNSDETPYTTELDTATVILWNFSSKIDETSFHVNNYFLLKFKEEYCRHDSSDIA